MIMLMKNVIQRASFLAAILLSLTLFLSAQQSRAPEYLLGPGDHLQVSVHGLTELNQTVRVSNSGKIHLPYLGVVKVYGMSPTDLEIELAKRLREENLIKDPWVRVKVVEFRSQAVYILGECMQPGQYIVPYEFTILDLITMAGGCLYTNENSGVAFLYRRRVSAVENAEPTGEASEDSSSLEISYEVTPIDFKPLVEGRDPELNMVLQGGDVLHVPRPVEKSFYVVGDVQAGGVFSFPQFTFDKAFTVSQAIMKAGGPSKTAKPKDCLLIRNTDSGERQEIAVDFEAIVKGKEPDFRVRPDDVIYVPGSATKSIAYGLLGLLPQVAVRGAQQAGVQSY